MAPPPRFRPGRDRAALLADLPRGYNPYLHVAVPNLFGALVIGLCLRALDGPTMLQWLVVPAMVVVSIAAEWRFHRDLLHRRVHPFTAFYDYHTVSHHSVYQRGDMAIREPRELRGILFPIWAIFFVFALNAPIARPPRLAARPRRRPPVPRHRPRLPPRLRGAAPKSWNSACNST